METIEIDINCDLGEGVGNEEGLMPYISSCNIACGGHAGTIESIEKVVDLARKHQVKIGAHPSYPDPGNFGRVSMKIPENQLVESIQEQMHTLMSVLKSKGISLSHIKAHGALYNDIAKNTELANAFLKGIGRYVGLASIYVPFGSTIAKEAPKNGFEIIKEAFADRNYNFDLSLVSRKLPESVITDSQKILEHLLFMVKGGYVRTLEGRKTHIEAETYCIHGDTPSAVEILAYLSEELPKHNIRIKK